MKVWTLVSANGLCFANLRFTTDRRLELGRWTYEKIAALDGLPVVMNRRTPRSCG